MLRRRKKREVCVCVGEHQSKGIIEKGIKKKEFKGTLSKEIDRGDKKKEFKGTLSKGIIEKGIKKK